MVRIAVDMDEVIADFIAKGLGFFNKRYEKGVLLDRKLREIHPEHTEDIRGFVKEADYFSDLPLIDGAKEALERLAVKHEIFITTATTSRLFD